MARVVLFAVLVAATLAPRPVAAVDPDDLPVRRLRFAEREGQLVASGTFTDVFDAALLEGLSSGFATYIVVRSVVSRVGEDDAVWFSAATIRVVYDLWEERYLVQIRDPAGERTTREATRADALRVATTLAAFPLAPLDRLPPSIHHVVAIVVEVNPVSKELLADVRRWLTRPRGGQVGGDSSFFGSFVSIFVNPRVPAADRTLHFRSQPFYRVPR